MTWKQTTSFSYIPSQPDLCFIRFKDDFDGKTESIDTWKKEGHFLIGITVVNYSSEGVKAAPETC